MKHIDYSGNFCTGDDVMECQSQHLIDEMLNELRNTLPRMVSRKEGARHAQLKVSTLANRDCLGTGPESVVIGGRIFYPKESFIEWFAAQLKPGKSRPTVN